MTNSVRSLLMLKCVANNIMKWAGKSTPKGWVVKMSLPSILAPIYRRNPNYKPVFVDGSPYAINSDECFINIETQVEVVQLNLNTGGMRVRWNEPDPSKKKGFRVESCDIDIQHFYKHYSIKSNYQNG